MRFGLNRVRAVRAVVTGSSGPLGNSTSTAGASVCAAFVGCAFSSAASSLFALVPCGRVFEAPSPRAAVAVATRAAVTSSDPCTAYTPRTSSAVSARS